MGRNPGDATERSSVARGGLISLLSVRGRASGSRPAHAARHFAASLSALWEGGSVRKALRGQLAASDRWQMFSPYPGHERAPPREMSVQRVTRHRGDIPQVARLDAHLAADGYSRYRLGGARTSRYVVWPRTICFISSSFGTGAHDVCSRNDARMEPAEKPSSSAELEETETQVAAREGTVTQVAGARGL
jgi:hypothetical protein